MYFRFIFVVKLLLFIPLLYCINGFNIIIISSTNRNNSGRYYTTLDVIRRNTNTIINNSYYTGCCCSSSSSSSSSTILYSNNGNNNNDDDNNNNIPSERKANMKTFDNSISNVATTNNKQESTTTTNTRTQRGIRKIEKFARLPVWPVWNGVFIWIISKLLGNDIAAKLENTITGRVCPNFYNYQDTSPFIMLVHHCHSFSKLDPLRYIQRTFFPEGFPAHPHRGFITITYILNGGFIHRDSVGIKQVYGAEKERHNGKHTQWLMTGNGMLHEEMFDINYNKSFSSRQELYQIWLNVPKQHKFDKPNIFLLGSDDETPIVEINDTKTLILAGNYNGYKATVETLSDLCLFHVTIMESGSTWIYNNIPDTYENAFIYIRKGSIKVLSSSDSDSSTSIVNNNNNNDNNDKETTTTTIVPVHHTAYFDKYGDTITVTTGKDGADFMFLAGVPLNESCVASGSMVMTNPREIDQAYIDYQNGLFGIPWDHRISDNEWRQHINKNSK